MQRRKHQRMAVSIPVRIFVGKETTPVPGDIEDISLGGAFVRCSKPIPIGEKIRIEIHFSGIQVLEGKVTEPQVQKLSPPPDTNETAEIKWSQSGSSFGIEFNALNLAAQNFLNKLAEHLRKSDTAPQSRIA